MRRAIALSAEKMRAGLGGPFGALIARDGKIIAEGFNQVTSNNDPTAHAEVVAIRAACRQLHSFSLQGCEMYTSCEPCPMCLGAIYWARLERVYYANTRSDAATSASTTTTSTVSSTSRSMAGPCRSSSSARRRRGRSSRNGWKSRIRFRTELT